jgi:hypothetical protein
MTQQEHLQKIKSKCEQLLALAEERTQGKWVHPTQLATHIICANSLNNGKLICDFMDSSPDGNQYVANAAFTAACAESAEAGWRTTLVTIDAILLARNIIGSPQEGFPSELDDCYHKLNFVLEAITAAWPEELL